MSTELPKPGNIYDALNGAYRDIEAGNLATAEPILRDAIKELPDQSPEAQTCLTKLGEICQKRGQYADAVRITLRLLHDLMLQHGENNDQVFATMAKLADLYEGAGRFDEADYFRTRLSTLKQKILNEGRDDSIDKSGKLSDQNQGQDGSPSWLSQAYDEANKLYGSNRGTKQGVKTIFVRQEAQDFEKRDETKSAPTFQTQPPADDVGGISTSSAYKAFASHTGTKADKYQAIDRDALRKLEDKFKPAGSQSSTSIEAQQPEPSHRPARKKSQRSSQEVSKEIPAAVASQPLKRESKEEPRSFKFEKKKQEKQGELRDMIWEAGKLAKGFEKFKVMGASMIGGARHNSQEKELRDLPLADTAKTRAQMDAEESELSKLAADAGSKFREFIRNLRDPKNLSRLLINIAVGLVILYFVADKFLPRSVTAADVYAEHPAAYRSADGSVQLRLNDTSHCQIRTDKSTVTKSYSMFLGDWRDIIAVVVNQLTQKERMLYRDAEGLLSEDGPMLYTTGGPALQLSDDMEHLADQVLAFYGSQGAFPNSSLTLSQNRINYRNPYTGKTATPHVDRIHLESDQDLSVLMSTINQGRKWSSEAEPNPGSIDCCLAVVKAPSGSRHVFIIRGFDGYARPLTSSLPGSAYTISLEDGTRKESVDSSSQSILFSGNAVRPQMYWLLERGNDPLSAYLIRFGGVTLFGGLALLLGGLTKFGEFEGKSKEIMMFTTMGSGALALLFLWMRQAP